MRKAKPFPIRLTRWPQAGALVLMAGLFLAGFLGACGQNAASRPLVGLSLATQREERWVRDKERMIEAAAKAPCRLEVRVADNDAARQLAQCQELFDLGINVLILAPQDAESAAIIVRDAHERRIPVISYDRLVIKAGSDVYLSFDNEEVGHIQAEYLLSVKPKGRYAIFSGAPTDNNSSMFLAGALRVLEPNIAVGNVEVVYQSAIRDWLPAEAYRLAARMLAEGILPDAILAPNDGTAGGIIQAIQEARLVSRIVVTGQDAEISAARRVLDGTQAMTVFKDTRLLAELAIRVALDLAAGRPVSDGRLIDDGAERIPAIYLKPVLVTRENIRSALVDSGYIKASDLE